MEIPEVFQDMLETLALYPQRVLEIDYDIMLDFFIVLYKTGQLELCSTLISHAYPKYGEKMMHDLIRHPHAPGHEDGVVRSVLVNVDEFVKISEEEFNALDKPKYLGKLRREYDNSYWTMWEYNGIKVRVKTKEKHV